MSVPPVKRRRIAVSVTVKKEICRRKLEYPKATQADLLQFTEDRFKLSIGRSTISDILRDSAKWLEEEDSSSTKKRAGYHEQLEKALWLWFCDIRSRNLAVSDEMLQEKGRIFGQRLGVSEGFNFSRGWLQGFKQRHKICLRTIHGEAASVDQAVVSVGREKLLEALSGYQLRDIYNMDETGLFFRLEPNKTLATGPVSGTKKCKQRISVALCANADGSDKLKPLVIGKAARPRCFPKTFNVQTVVDYHYNQKAWMTAIIFQQFLEGFDRLMRNKNRHVVLLLDNAPSHKVSIELTNVKVLMLPPNTTSHIQPMDAGIINNFKVHYKRSLVKHYVREIDEKGSFERVDLKQAIYFVKDSWNNVRADTIANCFHHVKIIPTSDDRTPQAEVSFDASHLQADIDRLNLDSPLSAAEFLSVDMLEDTEAPLTEDDIVQLVQGNEEGDGECEDSQDHLDSNDSPRVTLKEGIHHGKLLLAALEQHEAFGEEEYAPIRKILNSMHSSLISSATQKKISDFFKPPCN
jgi:hypothetical protein